MAELEIVYPLVVETFLHLKDLAVVVIARQVVSDRVVEVLRLLLSLFEKLGQKFR